MMHSCRFFAALAVIAAGACTSVEPPRTVPAAEFYGTLEPFASEAVYFVMTDRFVDGDPGNNHVGQGGADLGTFDRPVRLEGLPPGNIGYLGDDFKGILDNAEYVSGMGFTAIWITPIVDNPDEAFTGGILPGEGMFTDQGKTGYHGYWGVNFFVVDEHLESPGLTFADFTARMRAEHDIKIALDIVCNHGSPSWTMPVDQPKYGEIYDADGRLVADHQNLPPGELDYGNPLHYFYRREPDLAELGDTNWENPAVLEYFVAAYSQWMSQGAAALRVDTIRHMPHDFWNAFSQRIRDRYPGLFMFAEAYTYDPAVVASYTHEENGAMSVLDFPGQAAMNAVFAADAPYSSIPGYLELESGIYRNPYELMTFYDNHDMPRMAADEDGFIDAHNWLFTSRGIPIVYYGSEIGFRAGAEQHSGNRDYFGQDRIDEAGTHPIRAALANVAAIRRGSVALQRGLQANVAFTEDTAAFFRVFQHDGVSEQALVLLNKGDAPATIAVDRWLTAGEWQDAVTGESIEIRGRLELEVPAHGLRVLLNGSAVDDPEFRAVLGRLQRRRIRE